MTIYRVFILFADTWGGRQTTVKFAKLLEDGRRLENLSWRLTFPGLASHTVGGSGSKQTANQVKTLAPQFDGGVLLHTTVTPGNVQKGTFCRRNP